MVTREHPYVTSNLSRELSRNPLDVLTIPLVRVRYGFPDVSGFSDISCL